MEERLRKAILDKKGSQIKDLPQQIEVLQQTLQSMSFEIRVESDQRMLELTNARLTSKMLATAMSDPPIPAVIDFSAVFKVAHASHQTPAGLVEALMPDVSKTSWLLITSDSLVGATESTTLTMVLERAIPLGVAIALDVAAHLSRLVPRLALQGVGRPVSLVRELPQPDRPCPPVTLPHLSWPRYSIASAPGN